MAGRPSKYETHIKPYLDQIKKWIEDGATEKQIQEQLHIGHNAWIKYKKENKELKELLKNSRINLVSELRGSLVKKALGFSHTVRKAMKLKEVTYKEGKRLREVEHVEYYDEEIYIPPETTAIFGALNIYDDEYVKDKNNYKLREKELKIKEAVAKANNFDLDID